MRTLLLAAACLLLAGCQASSDSWQTLALPEADYARAFEAARDAIAEEFVVARADAVEGLIESEYREFQRTGDDRAAGAYLTGGAAQQYRRKVVCRVSRAPAGAAVELRVDLEREGTSQAETLLIGTEGGDRRQSGAPRTWQYDPAREPLYWADIGRDTETEDRLLDRIRRRLESPPEETAL